MLYCKISYLSLVHYLLTTAHPTRHPGAVLGKNIWGAGPSSFGRQQRLSEITIEPITSTIKQSAINI